MHQNAKGNQAGLVYYTEPRFISIPGVAEGLRLYKNSLDDLWYTKNSEGVSELLNPFQIVENYRGQTTDALQHEIFVGANPGQRVIVETNTSSLFQIFAGARQTNNVPPGSFGDSGFAGYQFTAKNINGVVTIQGLVGEQPLQFGDPATLAWTLEVVVTANELTLLVRGEAGKNINWRINFIELVKVTGEI